MSETRVPLHFIKKLQGKDFVLYSGLLELAHQDGLNYSHTEILQFPTADNGHTCIIRAIVRTGKGEFSGIGDASPTSVPNAAIAVHAIRMAETRAMARALRVATNVGMTALEELGEMDKVSPTSTPLSHHPLATEEQKASIQTLCKSLSLIGSEFTKWLAERKLSWGRMTTDQAKMILTELARMKQTADDAVAGASKAA